MRVFLVLLILCSTGGSYKILVYNPKMGHSPSNFLGRIADLLVEAGHDVTSLIPTLHETVRDGTYKSKIIRIDPHPEVKAFHESTRVNSSMNFFEKSQLNPIVPFFVGNIFGRSMSMNCRQTLEYPGLIDRLNNEHFDVMIAENFDMCGIGISHVIKPKALIGASSSFLAHWQYEEFGVPVTLSYRPSPYIGDLDVHSTWSRLKNAYAELLNRITFRGTRTQIEAIFREKYGVDFPSLQEISSRVAYVFTNSEPLIDSAAPTLNRVINIGGLGAKEPATLDKEWEEVLSRRDRTVLISFGSMAKSVMMPEIIKKSIVKMVTRFPDVTFIWKYEEPEDEFILEYSSKVSNLVLTKWMPQSDLLNHERMAAFISHSGMGSTQETALRGVPALFIPLYGDQPRNAGMMVHNGFGKIFDKWQLADDEKLAEALREILENESYKRNAKRVSQMLANKPHSPKEEMLKYVEFAARFGPSSALRPLSCDMSFIAYHNLDIIVLCFLLVLFSVYLFSACLLMVIRILSRRCKRKTD